MKMGSVEYCGHSLTLVSPVMIYTIDYSPMLVLPAEEAEIWKQKNTLPNMSQESSKTSGQQEA